MADKSTAKNHLVVEERVPFRDLILKVERFLKYASKGTAPELVAREAQEFDRRLDEFGQHFGYSRVDKLRDKLQKFYKGVGRPKP